MTPTSNGVLIAFALKASRHHAAVDCVLNPKRRSTMCPLKNDSGSVATHASAESTSE